jgi:hypothetical protein
LKGYQEHLRAANARCIRLVRDNALLKADVKRTRSSLSAKRADDANGYIGAGLVGAETVLHEWRDSKEDLGGLVDSGRLISGSQSGPSGFARTVDEWAKEIFRTSSDGLDMEHASDLDDTDVDDVDAENMRRRRTGRLILRLTRQVLAQRCVIEDMLVCEGIARTHLNSLRLKASTVEDDLTAFQMQIKGETAVSVDGDPSEPSGLLRRLADAIASDARMEEAQTKQAEMDRLEQALEESRQECSQLQEWKQTSLSREERSRETFQEKIQERRRFYVRYATWAVRRACTHEIFVGSATDEV